MSAPRGSSIPGAAAGHAPLPRLTLRDLKTSARAFARELTATPISSLYGVTDGKAVGTYVEGSFNTYIVDRYRHTAGNAAKGIDFPALRVDLKVTSIAQPQSSCPFRDATQKVYGLGYHLLVMVYEKTDDPIDNTSKLAIRHVIFIKDKFTADQQTTIGLAGILDRGGNVDDIDGFLQERMLPLDDIGRRALAERILAEPPRRGHLTISNALQWRLQYGHAIRGAQEGVPGLEELVAKQ